MSGQHFFDPFEMGIAPNKDEIELSVFGKGFGECIVLCLKNQEIIVIDSFINPETKNPIAIDYLKCLHFPTSSIKRVVLTHWHQDHISGISEVLNKAGQEVKIVLSPIIKENEFNDFIEKSPNTQEFKKVYEFIKRTGGENLVFAGSDRRVYSGEKQSEAEFPELFSLSPSDKDLYYYLERIKNKPLSNSQISYSPPDDNLLSIVLLMKYCQRGFLLGSDMETSNSRQTGWEGIVKGYSHKQTKSSIFKVPHHGSITGHLDDVWTELLSDHPVSVTTVYNKGSKLPTEGDIGRIKALSSSFYVVGNKGKKDKTIMSLIRKTLPNARVTTVPQEIGLFRYRKNTVSGNESVETFGAVQMHHSDD